MRIFIDRNGKNIIDWSNGPAHPAWEGVAHGRSETEKRVIGGSNYLVECYHLN